MRLETISRNAFIRQCVGAGVGSFLLTHRSALGSTRVAEDEFYRKIVRANNEEVASLLKTLATDIIEVKRRYGFDLANLAAAYCEPTSQYFERADLPAYMAKIIRFLSQAQHADGTLDIGKFSVPPRYGVFAGAFMLGRNDPSCQYDSCAKRGKRLT